MANINLRKYRKDDRGLNRELGEAKQRLDKPGHFNRAQRQDAKELLKQHGVNKSERWRVFDE